MLLRGRKQHHTGYSDKAIGDRCNAMPVRCRSHAQYGQQTLGLLCALHLVSAHLGEGPAGVVGDGEVGGRRAAHELNGLPVVRARRLLRGV